MLEFQCFSLLHHSWGTGHDVEAECMTLQLNVTWLVFIPIIEARKSTMLLTPPIERLKQQCADPPCQSYQGTKEEDNEDWGWPLYQQVIGGRTCPWWLCCWSDRVEKLSRMTRKIKLSKQFLPIWTKSFVWELKRRSGHLNICSWRQPLCLGGRYSVELYTLFWATPGRYCLLSLWVWLPKMFCGFYRKLL